MSVYLVYNISVTDYLYIHIPFCVRKCIYCDFLSFRHDKDLVDTYIDALCKELLLKKGSAGVLRTIYVGGGTPSLLNEDCFLRLFRCLRDNYIISNDAEITVEANPCAVVRSKVDMLRCLGVNRISLGVQSFNDAELNFLGRVHKSSDAVSSAEIILQSGIDNLSLDLIYGIPGQTIETWQDSLMTAAGLSPFHISTYELTPEQGTPLYEMVASGQIKLHEEEPIIAMHNYATEYLCSRGFEHYEISNLAMPGFRCVHNLNYWDRGEYMGAGLGAHSFINGCRYSNSVDLKNYIRQLDEDIIPNAAITGIDSQEAMREYLFLGLRKIGGISISGALSMGLDIAVACTELTDEGFIEICVDSLRLTRKGLTISNTVIVRMFELLGL